MPAERSGSASDERGEATPVSEFRLRQATLEDLGDIMRLEESGFHPGSRESREVFLERIEVFPSGALIALRGDRVIGCSFSEIWQHRDACEVRDFSLGHSIQQHHDPAGNELYVSSMTVDPACRGTGIGERFFTNGIDYVTERFPTITSVLLLVNEEWRSALKIYRKAGFEEVAVLPDFFAAEGRAASRGLVMRKVL
jgi:ribosomal-protein-alanine N-acetyltransferase